MHRNRMSALNIKMGKLICGFFLYVMWFCEYTTIPTVRKTKLFCFCNIWFFFGTWEINKVIEKHFVLQATSRTTVFDWQKNIDKETQITHHQWRDIYPVIAWELVVLCILSYKGVMINLPINTIMVCNKMRQIKSCKIMEYIRNTVHTIGKWTHWGSPGKT